MKLEDRLKEVYEQGRRDGVKLAKLKPEERAKVYEWVYKMLVTNLGGLIEKMLREEAKSG